MDRRRELDHADCTRVLPLTATPDAGGAAPTNGRKLGVRKGAVTTHRSGGLATGVRSLVSAHRSAGSEPPTNQGSSVCCQAAISWWSSAVRVRRSSFVGDHEPPQMVRESSLQAAHGLVAGLALGDLVVEVVASGAITHADLGNRDQTDRRVQLPVPATRRAVPRTAPHIQVRDSSKGLQRSASERRLEVAGR